MARPAPLLLIGLLAALGCSGEYRSELLAVRYTPPSGAKLLGEEAGPPKVARFSGGIELRSWSGPALPIDEAQPEWMVGTIAQAAGLEGDGAVLSAKVGSLPAGQVARFELKRGHKRTLLYYLPLEGRSLVATLSAPESQYGKLESRFERSLSSLRAE